MMEDVPGYVAGTFIAIIIAVLGFIYYAVNAAIPDKKTMTPAFIITFLIGWIFLISVLTFNGYFTNLSGIPRLPLFAGFITLIILSLFLWRRSRAILIEIPITTLHYVHIIRVPVEMVLWWLAVSRAVPFEMTFEGSNLDILSGISAPFAAVFMVGQRSKSKIGAILWNLIALGLLIKIVTMAVSYAPYYFTPTGNEVANLGIFYFPYVLLPTFIVPIVFFSHLVAIYQLAFKKEDQSQFDW